MKQQCKCECVLHGVVCRIVELSFLSHTQTHTVKIAHHRGARSHKTSYKTATLKGQCVLF